MTDVATAPAGANVEPSADHDLTPVLSTFLDRHLVLPLLEFLSDRQLYNPDDILRAKIDLLQKTNMIDFAMQLYQTLHQTEEQPADMLKKRQTVVEQLQHYAQAAENIISLFQNTEVLAQLRQDKFFNIKFLQDNYNFKVADLDILYQYAKFQYETGNYAGAAEMLYHFRVLSMDQEKNVSALWGKLACEILLLNWDSALEDMNALRQYIDAKGYTSPLHVLQQRSWLIHWGLFIFFNHPKGRDVVVEMLLQPAYKQTIQTTCPHILRYLATAVIINRRRRDVLRELVSMIQQESNSYTDPILQFVECLYVNFDFDAAQRKLRECEQVLASDFFLESVIGDFIENARLFIFETYCKIHQRIDIGMLAERLHMQQSEAERWIVDLIRNASLDAKIDSSANCVIMGQPTQNVYHMVIEKTKNLAFRTAILSNNIDKQEQTVKKHGANKAF